MQNENSFAEGELKYLAFPKGFSSVKSSGKDKLPPLATKAAELAKKIENEVMERNRKLKIEEAKKAQQEKLNKISPALQMVKELGGEMSGKALIMLVERKAEWKEFAADDKKTLGINIMQGQFFKQKKTKGIREKYPDLLELVELMTSKQLKK
jgi:hypothetical protein